MDINFTTQKKMPSYREEKRFNDDMKKEIENDIKRSTLKEQPNKNGIFFSNFLVIETIFEFLFQLYEEIEET